MGDYWQPIVTLIAVAIAMVYVAYRFLRRMLTGLDDIIRAVRSNKRNGATVAQSAPPASTVQGNPLHLKPNA